MRTISVARDFSRDPGPRYKWQGRFSGEAFRKEWLVPALKQESQIIVDLDGTTGYGSSFLDEAFGGLVRSDGFTASEIQEKLELISREDESYALECWEAIREARPDPSTRHGRQ